MQQTTFIGLIVWEYVYHMLPHWSSGTKLIENKKQMHYIFYNHFKMPLWVFHSKTNTYPQKSSTEENVVTIRRLSHQSRALSFLKNHMAQVFCRGCLSSISGDTTAFSVPSSTSLITNKPKQRCRHIRTCILFCTCIQVCNFRLLFVFGFDLFV